jgi:hypothetical protein
VTDFSEPTVLWRLRRGTTRAHATVFATPDTATFAWFFDGMLDRVENYDTLDLALARSEDIRGVLLRDGWTEEGGR